MRSAPLVHSRRIGNVETRKLDDGHSAEGCDKLERFATATTIREKSDLTSTGARPSLLSVGRILEQWSSKTKDLSIRNLSPISPFAPRWSIPIPLITSPDYLFPLCASFTYRTTFSRNLQNQLIVSRINTLRRYELRLSQCMEPRKRQ